MKRYLIMSSLVLLGIPCGAQPKSFNDGNITKKYVEHGHEITHINNQDIMSLKVQYVHKDDNGLLWFIQMGNIKTYDGSQVKIYAPDKDIKLHDHRDELFGLYRDKKGNLFIPSNGGGGFLHYDNEEDKYERVLLKEWVESPLEDEYGVKWMGTSDGLLRINNSDTIEVQKIEVKSISKEIEPLINKWSAEGKLIESITKVGNNANLTKEFTLSTDTDVLLLGQGQLKDAYPLVHFNNQYADFGWIENEAGEVIWEMQPAKSYNAGGAFGFRTNVETLALSKGHYSIHYKSDGMFDFTNFDLGATNVSPYIKDWWGLQVFQVDAVEKTSLEQVIKDYEISSDLPTHINWVYKDKSGQLWSFGHSLHKINIKDDTSFEIEEVASWNARNNLTQWTQIIGICEKDQDNLWFSTITTDSLGQISSGLGIFNLPTETFQRIKTGLPLGTYDKIIRDQEANLWIAGSGRLGLYKLSPPFLSIDDAKEPNLSRFDLVPGKKVNLIESFELDDFNNLWVTTWHNGVFKINLSPPPFEHIDLRGFDQLGNKLLSRLQEDSHGNIWINTMPAGTFQYNLHTGAANYYNTDFKGIEVKYLGYKTELPNGNLLFQDRVRLIEYDVVADKAYLRNIPNWKTVDGRSQEKGFILNDSLVYVEGKLININHWTIQENLTDQLGGPGFCTGVKGKDNHFWVSLYMHETAHFKWTNDGLETIQKFPNEIWTTDMLPDENGSIWTLSSFYSLKKTEVDNSVSKIYTANEAMIARAASLFKQERDLWLFTQVGTFKFNTKTDEVSQPGRLADLRITDLTQRNNGDVMLLGNREIFILDPNKVEVDTLPPRIFIESISFVDEDSLSTVRTTLSSAFGFDHNQNDVTLSYNAVQYNQPEGITFNYQLENHQSDWQEVGKERLARFSNLPPGDYTFKVKAANADGIWSAPETLQFSIHPPWWQTWWAYLVYSLLIIGLLAYWYRSLQQKLKKEQAHNQELTALNEANQRFVPNDFLQILGKNSIKDLQLGDQVATKMTVFFSDIRDYTPLSESMTPEENFKFINSYLGRIGPVIKAHGGFISSYLGDGLMALFVNEPQNAIAATIAMQKELEAYNRARRAEGKRPLRTGMGLNTGDLMLGVIGDEHRYESTVISDAVNTASRMEGLTKVFGASIILSEKTLLDLEGDGESPSNSAFAYRYLGKVKVKGKDKALKIYDLYEGETVTIRQLKAQTHLQFEQGITHYYERAFGKAAECFKQVLAIHERDKAAAYYLDKSVHFIVNGVAADWSGVEEMVMK